MPEFGRIDVLGRFATGSTAVVWRGRQTELGRLVAVKDLDSGLRDVPGFLARLRPEAKILVELNSASE